MNDKNRAKILVSFEKIREKDLSSVIFFERKLKFGGVSLIGYGLLAGLFFHWSFWVSPVLMVIGCGAVIWGVYSSVYREAWQVIRPYLTDSEIERLKKVASEQG